MTKATALNNRKEYGAFLGGQIYVSFVLAITMLSHSRNKFSLSISLPARRLAAGGRRPAVRGWAIFQLIRGKGAHNEISLMGAFVRTLLAIEEV